MKSHITIFFAFILSSFGFGKTLNTTETTYSSFDILIEELAAFEFSKITTAYDFEVCRLCG
ncbi:hypothetical protein [Winogradskyella vidalii]|uniref:hypothetical protein n=1 Tax=Winogradskyella vidalii TaxID=2615024 RepID=UPI0015CEBFD4|nr:hypothetical protein [Winogradskyella vidalii]